jgi:hypothetical protein
MQRPLDPILSDEGGQRMTNPVASSSTRSYEVVEGWEQLPEGYAHRDVAGVAIDAEDRVFLICRGEHPIIVYDQKRNFLRSPPTGGFVCDRENDRIQIFSPDGEHLTEWTDTRRPTHLVFDGQGRAYVSELWWQPGQTSHRYGPAGEIRSGRVSVHDRDGRVLGRWGGPDPVEAGSFAAPHGIAVDSRGDVYVSEVTWTFAASRGHGPENCHTFQKFALRS